MTEHSVHLRSLTSGDRERLFHWRNSDDVRRYMYNDALIDRTSHDAWFTRALADNARLYLIIECNGVPVGLANFYDLRRSHRVGSWAYYLGDPSVRGMGIGACVEYLMIEKAFGELDLNKLWCEVLVTNEAVWKLHHGFGFVTEAHLRQHVLRNDGPQDVYGLGLLAAEWAGRRQACRSRLVNKGFALA